MDEGKRLEKLEKKRANTLPQTLKGKRLAEKIATIRENTKERGSSTDFDGLDSLFGTAAKAIELVPDMLPRIVIAPEVALPAEISSIEDPRLRPIVRRIVEELDDPERKNISEDLAQAINDAPLSDAFRPTMGSFVEVQRRIRGKLPRYRQ